MATVGGELIVALEQVLNLPITLTCAGRTDAGVHAWGQVVTFDAPPTASTSARSRPRSTGCAARPSWSGRRPWWTPVRRPELGVSRTYRYTVLNRRYPDPFLRYTTWHVTEPSTAGPWSWPVTR